MISTMAVVRPDHGRRGHDIQCRRNMGIIENFHEKHIFSRRTKVLARHISTLIPDNAHVLDVGCGDGTIDSFIKEKRSDVCIEGIDVKVRQTTQIPVKLFDGSRIPFNDNSFDTVLFVDVLHHTEEPAVLLAEAQRVARQAIVLKDHTRKGFVAEHTLRAMDWVGNAHHDVVLPYNYWSERQWRITFDSLGLDIEKWSSRLGLYPWPASLIFERSLHFIARLAP